MTLGIIVHSGDLVNLGDKQKLLDPFAPSSYVLELGAGTYSLNHNIPWREEGLYRMQPKDPDKQIERALNMAAKTVGMNSMIVRMIEFPLAEQGDYAQKASLPINASQHIAVCSISVCSPIGYFTIRDSITYRLLNFLDHKTTLVPMIRLSADDTAISQITGALATLAKEWKIAPCLQIVGGETMDNDQIDDYCKRVLAASSSLYLWSFGTVAGNPIAERIMKYMNDTYPYAVSGHGGIDMDQEIIDEVVDMPSLQQDIGVQMGTVAISDLSIRVDCSLAAKIVGSMQMGDRVEISEVIWPNPDLSFVHLKGGNWAVQHWSGIDYIILDETDNIKSSGGAL